MTVTKGTYYKALLLLIVFSMGTVVSFACSFSNLFHDFHHHNNPPSFAHQHVDQIKHVHDHTAIHHDHPAPKEEKKENCCSSDLVKMQKVEKSVSRSIQAPDISFVTSFVAAYAELFSLYQSEQKTFFPDVTRWRPPAIK